MLFAEFYGTPSLFAEVRSDLEAQIAGVFKASVDDVVIRRIEAESDYPGTEIWIELSSEEQLALYAREIARRVSSVIRGRAEIDVWVLFRVVPLAHVYLNADPRTRGLATQ